MTRPSVEQWENRQLLLNKLEQDPGGVRLSGTHSEHASELQVIGQALRELSAEMNSHGGEWSRAEACQRLKENSGQMNSADLLEDPKAPLKAFLSDVARFTASAETIDPKTASAFFENLSVNSSGVFADPRAGRAFDKGNAPRDLLVAVTSNLTLGMEEVNRRVVGQKALDGVKQAASVVAIANRPKSAYEIENNMSFDVERENKADPFKHLRGKDLKIERNEQSKMDYSTNLAPK